MKVKLNLLPKSREKKIRNRKILKFIILQEVMIIFITIFFFALVQGVNKVSTFQLDELNQKIAISNSRDDYLEIRKYEDDIRLGKERVSFINLLQKNEFNWLVVFEKFSNILTPDIILSSVNIDGYLVTIDGVAKNRDALVGVKNGFEKDDCFRDINIPLNDIVLKNDIDFELKLNVNEKCIKNYEK